MSATPHARKRRQSNYLRGVGWIAMNGRVADLIHNLLEVGDDDGIVETLSGYGSVHVLATVFDLPTDLVARDILTCHRIERGLP